MAQYCFDDKAAAAAAVGDSKRLRVYEVDCPKLSLKKFVPSPSAELAIARVAAEFGEFTAQTDRAKSKAGRVAVPTQKQINQLIEEAASAADPVVAQETLKKVASLRQQMEAAKAARKAEKVNQAAPTPPAPPAGNVPAPPPV